MCSQAGRQRVVYPAFLAILLVPWAHAYEDPSSPISTNGITINNYGNCSNSVELEMRISQLEMTLAGQHSTSPGSGALERRVSQLEETVVKQQGLIMDLMGQKGVDMVGIKDCSELDGQGNRPDGVYTLRPTNGQSFSAYCQFDEDGAWTVIQRRVNGSVDFQRSWIEYKNGFGVMDSNFWLGNDNIHALANQRQMELRVELTDWDGESRQANYKLFRIGGEDELYKLYYEDYSGTAGDSLDIHKNMKFSTLDQDHDRSTTQCSRVHGGGWWFNKCDSANLNGYYLEDPTGSDYGVEWTGFKNRYSLKESTMKIKPAFPN